jgi:iron complex transport system substrate-binding protein
VRRTLLVTALVGAALLAACGSNGESGTADAGSDTRTVTHQFGTVDVPSDPKRIVAIGATDGDVLATLGIKMVGVRGSGGFSPDPTYPWLHNRAEIAGATVIQPDANGNIDVEKVAALRPDLVFAVNSYVSPKQEYDALSRFAPVVASKTADVASEPWQDQVAHIAAALGKSEDGKRVVDDVQSKIEKAAADNPAWKGRSLSFVGVFAADSVEVVFGEKDYTRKLLAELGFTVPAAQLRELPALLKDKGGTQASVSLERLNLLEADGLVIAYANPELRPQLEARPNFKQLDVVRDGRNVTTDFTVAAALRLPSPLSVPYVVDALVPPLAKSLPATKP